MNDQAPDHFIDKWRARWPEWHVAQVFVPHAQRATAPAWFALRQELTDAAWGGTDPRPGEAKLAWWAEELIGWTQGRRRHPLGAELQRLPAPWALLAECLPALRASRERPADAAEAVAVLEPFAEGISGVAAALFEADLPAPSTGVVLGLLAEHALLAGEQAVPLQALARGDSGEGLLRSWSRELLRQWPLPREGSRAGRVYAALVRHRLQRLADGVPLGTPAPAWSALLPAWRAARR
jgi:hypothetical protein